MNSIITAEAIQMASNAAAPVPAIAEASASIMSTVKAMPTAAKVAIGAGAAGVIIGGSYLGYRCWRKHHPKSSDSNPRASTTGGTLDDEADEIDAETMDTETYVEMHGFAAELAEKLYKAGFKDRETLIGMVETVMETLMHKPSKVFIETAVDAGVMAVQEEEEQ